ncbi:MAG: hypothetical protein REI94_16950 [Moraxellaceae bacterium]|nr:hypothetical protein [Moraxellaceae bacterium]
MAFIIVGALSYMAGLGIGAVILLAIGGLLLVSDIYDWWQERRAGF